MHSIVQMAQTEMQSKRRGEKQLFHFVTLETNDILSSQAQE
jgi:hypothetical protein